MRRHEEQLEALGVRVLVITFDVDFLARAYIKSTQLRWPLLADPERKLYSAYGMLQLSWLAHFNPASIAKYLLLMLRGFFPGRPGADWQQLGGDILIDPDGVVRMVYRSATPHDRPNVARILAAVQKSA